MTRTRALVFIIILQICLLGWLSYRALDAASGLRQLGRENTAIAANALNLATAIQQQRIGLVRVECEAQNRRHTETIRTFHRILVRAKRHAHGARRAQIAESRRATVLLIDALAPYQNCTRAVRRATTTP